MKNIDAIIREVESQHPYKDPKNRDTYNDYNQGWSDACDILGHKIREWSLNNDDPEMKRLYDWLMDENRKPANTAFTAGWTRNVAREIEFKLNEAAKRQK